MTAFEQLQVELRARPRHWLVTGAAGFIGSNLVEHLLKLDQQVVGFDNYLTGHPHNLEQVRELVGDTAWKQFSFIEGDIRDADACVSAAAGADVILHQGALGSVPRSIEDPVLSHDCNATGTIHMLQAAVKNDVPRFVYASSSSVYGDSPTLPKVEENIGRCLSPYAATKLVDEIYAGVFCQCYGLAAAGLRYFNVFGPRQDPNGAYAAVIPKWIDSLLQGETVWVNGDGETSRDFCHVENVVQANLLAAIRPLERGGHSAFNVALGERTTLNELFGMIRDCLVEAGAGGDAMQAKPEYREFRDGDVRHSLADISAIQRALGFEPTHDVARGLRETISWYVADHRRRKPSP